VGATKKHALLGLESALEEWVNLALKRGIGLPYDRIESKL
jgi:hypothetical protein